MLGMQREKPLARDGSRKETESLPRAETLKFSHFSACHWPNLNLKRLLGIVVYTVCPCPTASVLEEWRVGLRINKQATKTEVIIEEITCFIHAIN